MEKRTITITPKMFFGFFICLFLGLIITFGLQHNGKFSYLPDTSSLSRYDEYGRINMNVNVNGDTPIAKLIYNSPLGAIIEKEGHNLTVWDVSFSDTFTYKTKFPFILESTFVDYKYILAIGFSLYILLILTTKIKVRIQG